MITTLMPTTLMPTTLMATTLMATTRTGSAYTTANLVKCKGEMEKLLADKSLLEETRAWLKKGGGLMSRGRRSGSSRRRSGVILWRALRCVLCVFSVSSCVLLFFLFWGHTHTHTGIPNMQTPIRTPTPPAHPHSTHPPLATHP